MLRRGYLMTSRAKTFITIVLLAGVVVLGLSTPEWKTVEDVRFLLYLGLTLLAATLKVRLPAVEGTISVSFLFLVAATTQFGLLQGVIMAGLAGATQCLWKPNRNAVPIQVAFSGAVLILSLAAARTLTAELMNAIGVKSQIPFTAIAAVVFYGVDTLLVSSVICLVESRPLSAVWQQCNLWAFPYYLCGAVLLETTAAVAKETKWNGPIYLLPLMICGHLCYRTLIARKGEPERSIAAGQQS